MSNDTPTIKEAFEKAEGTLKSEGKVEEPSEDNSEESETAEKVLEEPETEKPEKVDKKADKDKPEKSEEKKEDKTLEDVDPEELPKELKPLYKNLMKGFTQGRQKDSKKVAELEKKLEALGSEKIEEEKPKETPKFNTPQEYYKWQAEQTAKKVVEDERLDAFRKQALIEYDALDSRLTKEGEKYDPVVDAVIGSQLDELLADHVKEHGSEIGFNYKTQAKKLLDDWDQYLDSNIKNYMVRQNKLAKEKAKEFKKKSSQKPGSTKVILSKKMSIRQAMKAAMEKIGG